mgnify:CR=1 FL=1|jgi:hypothetical protein
MWFWISFCINILLLSALLALLLNYKGIKEEFNTLLYRFEQIMLAFEEVDEFLYIITKSNLFSTVYLEHEPLVKNLLDKIKNLKTTISSMFNIDPSLLEPEEKEERDDTYGQ